LIIVCTLLSVLLISAVVAIKGHVSGSEFSPSHFQTREFTFYEIPFVHLQITPIRRKDTTTGIARQIRAKSWINVPRGQKPTQWHLISLWRGPTATPAVASLLSKELELQGSAGSFWEDWNSDHPQRASALWPVVQRLAERELYIMIPELLQTARTLPGSDDAVTLSAAIDRWLIDQYVGLVKDLRDAQRIVLADELLAEAMTDFPQSETLAALKSDRDRTAPVATAGAGAGAE
jgi:hypothetical protein